MENQKLYQQAQATFKEYYSLEGSLFRYSLSFSFLFALLPTLLVVIILIQYSYISLDSVTNYLYQYVPEELINPFITYIDSKSRTGFITTIVSLLVASYMGSRAFYSFSLIQAKQEKFNYPSILYRIKSFVLFVSFVVMIGIVISIVNMLKINFPLFLGIGLVIVFYLFYRTLSFQKRPPYFGLFGAIFVSILITLIGMFFVFFVNHFTNYTSIYGPLSSLFVLMVSIHLISSVIYMGYCINIHFVNDNEIKVIKFKKFYDLGQYIKEYLENLAHKLFTKK